MRHQILMGRRARRAKPPLSDYDSFRLAVRIQLKSHGNVEIGFLHSLDWFGESVVVAFNTESAASNRLRMAFILRAYHAHSSPPSRVVYSGPTVSEISSQSARHPAAISIQTKGRWWRLAANSVIGRGGTAVAKRYCFFAWVTLVYFPILLANSIFIDSTTTPCEI